MLLAGLSSLKSTHFMNEPRRSAKTNATGGAAATKNTGHAADELITFKVLLEYDGSRYSGWQDQKNARTVMSEVRKAAREVFHSEVDMQGAGRTDAGVHALGQVMHLKIASEVRHKPDTIAKRINDLLPADIVVIDVQPAARNFHARHGHDLANLLVSNLESQTSVYEEVRLVDQVTTRPTGHGSRRRTVSRST